MRKSLIWAGIMGIVLLAGGAFCVAAAPANAGGWANTRLGRFIANRIGRAADLRAQLNLSDAQRQAIGQVLLSHRQAIADAVKPVVDARRELRDVVTATPGDESAIRAAADTLGDRIGDAAVVLAQIKAELISSANLTPDQVQALGDFRADNQAAVDQFLDQLGQAQ